MSKISQISRLIYENGAKWLRIFSHCKSFASRYIRHYTDGSLNTTVTLAALLIIVDHFQKNGKENLLPLLFVH